MNRPSQNVLIVEDEGEMCLLLHILLKEGNIQLDHVSTIAAAAAYLEKQPPSVIILDNKLPDGFGIDLISFIKKNYPAVRIIMISGFSAEAEDVAMANGADAFLEKPFTRGQLYEVLNMSLQ